MRWRSEVLHMRMRHMPRLSVDRTRAGQGASTHMDAHKRR